MNSRVGRFRSIALIVVAISALAISAQETESITITEPGIYSIENLYKFADTVAIVEIVAGDMESYDIAIYKAKVITGFKGAASGQTIFFGPFIGERLGSQYVVFLQDVKEPISPKTNVSAAYGTVHYGRVFNEGYSSMEVSYSCVFHKRKGDLGCDDSVRVCTDYITLPKTVEVSPSMDDDTVPFGCRQARKSEFVPLLENLNKTSLIH